MTRKEKRDKQDKEEKILQKWKPVFENSKLNIPEDKMKWLSLYCDIHLNEEIKNNLIQNV